MRRIIVTIVALSVAACAGTDPPVAANSTTGTNQNQTPNSSNGMPNGTPNNGTTVENVTPNGTPNNVTPNANAGPNNTNVNPNNTNNTPAEWRALVANADLTGDTSSWNVVVFDGVEASVTFPQPFGSGSLAVAASGDRGYVVDLDTGMVVVVDATRGTEVETIDLGGTNLSAVASSGGVLVAASGANATIYQFSAAGGGTLSSIPLPPAGGGATLGVRSVAMDGAIIAGISQESAMFPTAPQAFLADSGTATLIDADPTAGGAPTIGVNGANRLDRLDAELFAVASELDGIQILRKDGATWVIDQNLVPDTAFGNAEVWDVVVRSRTEGVAFTFAAGPGFAAYTYDSTNSSATAIDGFALPSGLIGGDASADGMYYFLGDYGVRNQPNMPWGVGIVDAAGNLVDHLETDETLPPTDIVALN